LKEIASAASEVERKRVMRDHEKVLWNIVSSVGIMLRNERVCWVATYVDQCMLYIDLGSG